MASVVLWIKAAVRSGAASMALMPKPQAAVTADQLREEN
jgi:hypothetical protein